MAQQKFEGRVYDTERVRKWLLKRFNPTASTADEYMGVLFRCKKKALEKFKASPSALDIEREYCSYVSTGLWPWYVLKTYRSKRPKVSTSND